MHRAALEVDVLGDDPGHRDRRVRPQQLLDGGRHQLGLGDQAPTVVGMGGEVPHRRADRRPGGVDPGDQRERGDAEDDLVAERLAVVLGVQQLADEVVARLGLAALHLLVQVEPERLGAGLAAALVVGELEHVADPAGERVAHLLGHAEHQRDDAHRDLLGVVGSSVGAAVGDEARRSGSWHSSRVITSSSSTRRCENHGSISRRVQVCSGGSTEMGGSTGMPPADGGFSSASGAGGSTPTSFELKWAMSWEIAITSA